ncbi:carbonic anhydrase [Sandaracinobacteroides saxicola]|uniref:Carbonic anhydrase n=1 Tax=Sandaracinobacteroides saxicola TaxID=2759707 RepID=A0A7G5IJ76_9SPHN|nr:carbonic anhydrase [Sandaracinobacteroides saxicola]QMW23418.1 carbonic anhydrase [Sandaracinobacteroides saxicola]
MPEFRELIEGYRRFRTGPYIEQRTRFDALAQGQSPRVMLVACSDSRVDPSRVFDTAPGQMFVLRNVANLVPDYGDAAGQASAAAAIEYAVCVLKVHQIVVFGHARCGGIAASLSGAFTDAGPGQGQFIGKWMAMIEPARQQVVAAAALSPDVDAQRALEQAAVRLSLANLRSYPFVTAAETAGELKLQGAIFDIADGSLRVLDPATDRFETVPVTLPG